MLPGNTLALFASARLITPDGGIDAFTKLLLHFDETAGATVTNDASTSGNHGAATPFAGFATAAGGKFGGYGNFAGGCVQYADHVDWDFSSGDFTVDGWFYCTGGFGTTRQIIGQADPGVSLAGYSWAVWIAASNQLTASVGNGSTTFGASTATTITAGGWHHFAFVRTGNILKLFLDGIQEGGNIAFSGAVLNSAYKLGIGCVGELTGSQLWVGALDEIRISKGKARWTSNFIPLDKAYSVSNPRALLHFDGSEGGLAMLDDALGLIWTTQGTAKKTTVNPKFGSACLTLDGSGWVDTPASGYFDFGAGDLTIDYWFNVSGGTGNRRICGQCANGSNFAWGHTLLGNNTITCSIYKAAAPTSVTGTTVYAAPGWHHLAFVRTGDILKLFLDGVQEGGNVAFTGPADASANKLAVGRLGELVGINWNGQIDEFRMTVGKALWTANFTPPTLPAGTDADKYATKLLLHMDGANGSTTFGDSSASARGNAAVTNAQVSTAQSKFGGASGLFNGAAYLTYPDHVDFDFGSGDFTVDFFVRMAAVGTQYGFFGKTNNAITNGYYLYVNASGTLQFAWLPSDGPLISYQSAPLLLDTNWHHIAVVRSGTMINTYFDGVLAAQGPINAGASIVANTNAFTIGRLGDFTPIPLNGNIDEFRLTKGIARWMANFTPPTAPYS